MMFAKQHPEAIDCALVSSINLIKYISNGGIKTLDNENFSLDVHTFPRGVYKTLSLNNNNIDTNNKFLNSADETDILLEKIILSNKETFKIENIASMVYALTQNPYIIIDLKFVCISVIKNIKIFNKFVNNLIAPDFNLKNPISLKIYGCGTTSHDLAIETFNDEVIKVIDPLDPYNELVYTDKNFINFLADYKYFYISLDAQKLKSLPLNVYKKELDFKKEVFKQKIYRIDVHNKKNVLYVIYKSDKPNIRLIKADHFKDLVANMSKKSLYNNTNLEMKSSVNKSSFFITVENKENDHDTELEVLSDSVFSITELKTTDVVPTVKAVRNNNGEEDVLAEVGITDRMHNNKECTLFLLNTKTRVTAESNITFKIEEYSENYLINSFSTTNPYITFNPQKTHRFVISIEKPDYIKQIETGSNLKNISNLSSLDYTFYYNIKLYKYGLVQGP